MEINHETQLLLRLMRLSGRLQRRKEMYVSQPFEKQTGLNIKLFHALHLIQKKCDQPGDLVKEMGLPHSTVSRILEKLLAEGLIERSPHPQDLRQVQLKMSEAGQARYEVAWAHYLTCLHEGLGKLPEAELTQTVNALSELEAIFTRQCEAEQ
jgi:DNA-binding MarR family transcriptional regulator